MDGPAKEEDLSGGSRPDSRDRAAVLFRCADQVLLRAPVLSRDRAGDTWQAPAGAGGRDPASLTGYLRSLAADPLLREAVALASPSLSGQWQRALAGEELPARDLARMARGLTRYALRAAHRCTPFGLMAGVGLASFGDRGRAVLGADHRRGVRPDWSWLARSVARWEQDPDVLPGLRVVANNLCRVRDGRLIVPFSTRQPQAASDQAGGRPHQHTLRWTPAVRAAVEAARLPIPAGDLTGRLESAFPGVPAGSVGALIAQLVAAEALLTELRPPLDGSDPLDHLLRVLIPGTPPHRQVSAVRQAAADYAAGPPAGPAPVVTVGGERVRLQVDLALDADVVLPHAVAAEAERAATALWRLSRPGPGPLAGYHARFIEHYGAERLVPLAELLDPGSGLGLPAGYRMPPGPGDSPAPAPPAPTRGADAEAALLAAYCQAVAEGSQEIELDGPLLDRLTADPTDGDHSGLPSGPEHPDRAVELYAQLVADSVPDIERGDFTLVLADNASPLAGASAGRFGYLFPEQTRELARASAAATTRDSGALPVRPAHPVSQDRFTHVAQAPHWLDHDLLAGVYGDPSVPGTLPLDDIEIGADRRRFRIVSRRLGRELEPLAFHHLNRQAGLPNAVRFLLEAPHVTLPCWRPWDWGTLGRAPFLPAVRYGRTVLSAARWRPAGPVLTDPATPDAEWEAGFDRFRRRWGLPDDVELAASDQRIPLHLPAAAHRELLREELRVHGEALLLRPGYGGDTARGWLRGPGGGAHSAEIVVSLLPVRREPPPDARTAPPRTAEASSHAAALPPPRPRSAAHLPGGRWLYAQLDCPADQQDGVLTRHLAPLAAQLPEGVDRWFFVRYRDGGHHLRLRFHGDSAVLHAVLLPQLHAVARRLSEDGVSAGMSLATYDPEIERYGGPAAFPLAEEVFHADSFAVLGALSASAADPDPLLTTAAEVAAMARAFLPADPQTWTDWLTAAFPRHADHHRAFTSRRRAALDRITPDRDAGLADDLLHLLAEHGRLVRKTAEQESWLDPGRVLVSLLHLHCNRRLGIDPRAESHTYAIARGAAHAHHARATARR